MTIPRGVTLLAGESATTDANGTTTINVTASIDHPKWNIVQSPFMMDNAKTTSFNQKITIQQGKLKYSETTTVDIYGKTFNYTDQNELLLVM